MPALDQIDYAGRELLYNAFMRPALESAIATFAPPPGSRGLDVGCGPGGLFPLFDAAMQGRGSLTGLDISTGHLAAAHDVIREHGLEARCRVLQVDLREPLPFPDASFDWVWSADTLNSVESPEGFADPVPVVREMMRVVRPGGKVAIFFGNRLNAMYLPDYAHIEQCLATAFKVWHLKRSRVHPSYRHENALAWFQAAGVHEPVVTPHTVLYQAPLPPDVARYIQRYIFETEYKNPPDIKDYAQGAGMTEDDWETWMALSSPASPDYLLRRDDYFCIRYGLLTVGRVPDPAHEQPRT
ncbi:MAG: methyltransferase domain-containing protein [Chloroflexi bacterium]|nr:methyltransferase domain-containing protein [Chloroflexota bacterium]